MTFKTDHAPAKYENPENQRLGDMIRYFETKGLKPEQNFDKFIYTIRTIRKSSSTMLKQHKRNPVDTQNTKVKPPSPKIRKQGAEYEHLIVKNPHETDPHFQFTKNAKRAAQNTTKQHMLQIVSNLKHELKNPDQVVKYLTGNPIMYSNITERKINVVIREFPQKLINMRPGDRNLVEIRTKKSLSVVLVKTRDDGTTYLEDNPYNFKRVFEEDAPNSLLYAESVSPIVNLLLKDPSRCAMCISYGQRKSGKTYSLFGAVDQDEKPVHGVAQLAIKQLLDQTQKRVAISISFYEIYLGKIYDLLNNGNDRVQLREEKENVIIEGLSEQPIRSFDECCRLLRMGMDLRNGSLEFPNKDGSRSFVILLVKVSEPGVRREEGGYAGQLAFVDMAAFEHTSETLNNERAVRMLAHEIKRTLHSLLICSRNIEDSKKVPPFRESRVTTALQGFFSPSCQMLMIGHMIPLESEETLLFQLLNYCNRIQKPPGEVLDLQSSKYLTYETKKNLVQSRLPIKPLNYNIMTDGISEYLIDNQEAEELEINDLRRAEIAKPEKKSRQLMESISKDQSRFQQLRLDTPGAERTFSPSASAGRPHTSPHKEHHKKKRGLRGVKEELRHRKQLELEHLLQVTESPQSQKKAPFLSDDERPLSRKDVQKLPISKFGNVNSPPSQHIGKSKPNKQYIDVANSLQNDYFDRGAITEAKNGEGQEGEEDDESKTTREKRPISRPDSDIGYKINRAEKKAHKKLEKERLSITYGGKYGRSPDHVYHIMERFGSKFNQQVSPNQARKEANKLKNEFFRSLAEQTQTMEKSRTTESLMTRHEVFSSYMSLSKECHSEKTKTRRLRSAFGKQMSTIKSSYGKLGRKLETTEKEIDRRLKSDALEDYKNRVVYIPSRPKVSKDI